MPACLLVFAVLAAAPPAPPAVEGYREFRAVAARPLWPGFRPLEAPIEAFDGSRTYLFGHPHPPDGFRPLEDGFVFEGRHETVRANTGTKVEGVETATVDLSGPVRNSKSAMAALMVHETFHVYQRKAHPRWTANEADLFTYPLDDASLLVARRRETRALVRALASTDDASARAWTRTALAAREERFRKLPPEAVAYERGNELNEGLAQFVESRSIGRKPALTSADFPLEQVRQRGYATGQAMAVLLDRFAPGWDAAMDSTALDEVLRARVGPGTAAVLDAGDLEKEARREVDRLVASRRRKESEFRAVPGWSLEIVAGKEPLWPQGFDPLNVMVLEGNAVLHSRWIKLGNGSGTIEVLGRPALTEPAGSHPLFQGIRRLLVTGIGEPSFDLSGNRVTIRAEGVTASFIGAIERSGTKAIVRLP